MQIKKSKKTDVKAATSYTKDYYDYVYDNTNLPASDVRRIVRECWERGLSKDDALVEAKKLYENEDSVDACGDIKCSTSTDKALKHIKAAIDILATEAKDDVVAKDSIANLSVVLFDIKASKDCNCCGDIEASILTDDQKDELWEIADSYTTSSPKSGSWSTETAAEQQEIADHFGISMDEAKQIMIDELGFGEEDF